MKKDGKRMWKGFLCFFVFITILLSYQYQKPILETDEAIAIAKEHLQNPPEEWGDSFSDVQVQSVQVEDIEIFLTQKEGLFNKLTNKRQWNVTIKAKDKSPTVVFNAYNGEFIDIYGPLN